MKPHWIQQAPAQEGASWSKLMLDRCTQIPTSNIYLSPSSWGDLSMEKRDSKPTWVSLGRGHLSTSKTGKLCWIHSANSEPARHICNSHFQHVRGISHVCVTAISSYLSFTILWAVKWLNFSYFLKNMQTPQYWLCNAYQETTIYVVWYKAIPII